VQNTEVYPPPSEPSSAHTPIHGKTGLDMSAHSSESIKIELPLDIILSLLRPDELEKLQKYVASYLGKHWQP
jgi:hypothetical protein